MTPKYIQKQQSKYIKQKDVTEYGICFKRKPVRFQ